MDLPRLRKLQVDFPRPEHSHRRSTIKPLVKRPFDGLVHEIMKGSENGMTSSPHLVCSVDAFFPMSRP